MDQLPQHITHNRAVTVAIDVPARPSSTQTVSLYTGGGTAIFEDQAATLTSISTTLSASASRGASAISVASATNIAKGSTLWLTAHEDVRVKSVTGTNVQLWRPLMHDHDSTADAQSHRLTYAVSAANAGTLFWDGRLVWLIDSATVYQQPCICTKYPWYRHAGIQDWYAEEPRLYDLLDPEVDAEEALDAALAEVVKRVAAATARRAWTYVGPVSFVAATIYAAQCTLYRRQSGDAAEQLYARYREAFQTEIEQVTSGAAWRDEDQDSDFEAHEQRSFRSGRLFR